jgi:molybdopterin synthase catalytic subunit
MIEITHNTIDNRSLVSSRANPLTGATVLFLGTAREFTGDLQTESLVYEAYIEMATLCLEQLADQARQDWPIHELRIVHRLGRIELGETCVAVLVSCPHRHDAFAAACWCMDKIKELVPIWKKENWATGEGGWIHPSAEPISTRIDRSEL